MTMENLLKRELLMRGEDCLDGTSEELLARLLENIKTFYERRWIESMGQLYAGPSLPDNPVLYTGFHFD